MSVQKKLWWFTGIKIVSGIRSSIIFEGHSQSESLSLTLTNITTFYTSSRPNFLNAAFPALNIQWLGGYCLFWNRLNLYWSRFDIKLTFEMAGLLRNLKIVENCHLDYCFNFCFLLCWLGPSHRIFTTVYVKTSCSLCSWRPFLCDLLPCATNVSFSLHWKT